MAGVAPIPAYRRAPEGVCLQCSRPLPEHRDPVTNRTLACAEVTRRAVKASRGAAAGAPQREPLSLEGWVPVAIVESSSGAGAYEIRRDPDDGQIGCTCKGFTYRGSCKHVTNYFAQNGAAEGSKL